jgi:group I intron endonuclease
MLALENTSGIYKIQSKQKIERTYIGSGVNIQKRWWTHLCELRANKHKNGKLQNHFNKYGELDLQFSILLKCNKEDLIKYEQLFINSLNPYFNICKTAGSLLGTKRSNEVRLKMSKLRKGIKRKPHTEETKNKIRMAQIGKPRFTIEDKLKMSKERKGGHHSEITKEKMRGPRLQTRGRKKSEECKHKMSIKNKGCKPPFQSIPEENVQSVLHVIRNRGNKTLKQISIDLNISYDIIRDINCGKSYKREIV